MVYISILFAAFAVLEISNARTESGDKNNDRFWGDDFSEWNPDQKRLFGTFGWKSCWQFNHEPELSWIENDDENGEILAGGDFCHHRGFHGDRGKNLRGTGIWGGTPRLTKI